AVVEEVSDLRRLVAPEEAFLTGYRDIGDVGGEVMPQQEEAAGGVPGDPFPRGSIPRKELPASLDVLQGARIEIPDVAREAAREGVRQFRKGVEPRARAVRLGAVLRRHP